MKNEEYKNGQLQNLRHSAAHLLAAAIINIWPDTKRAIGPAIDTGFYCDFEFEKPLSEKDFPRIEQKMREIVKTWKGFEKYELTKEKALEEYKDNPYKKDLIEEFTKNGETVTFYKSGGYWDLCKGGHCENPKEALKHFTLLKIAGAYWRGNEKNKMLTRIYGTAFSTKEELDNYVLMLQEAEKRDHKKLAKEMDLIVFSELVGAGLPLYTPKGAIVRNEVYNFSRYLNGKIGYEETALPGVNRAELFKVSGHYEKYKEDMFAVHSHYSEEEFFLKPMNCPQHCEMYKSRGRSYRDLPIRFSDFSVLYRDERPGEINGLFRSRAFTQDDGHCFCREDQIGEEFENVLNVVDEALKTYGFDYWIRLSLSDPEHMEKYLGNEKIWKKAETTLRELIEKKKLPCKEAPGEAAIYGPKLDFMATDSLGREWQISTIQLDMNMAGRFGLEYTDTDGQKKTPVLIHRAIVGSERFIAILIEHFAGKFPVWLAPVQVALLPITDNQANYAETVNNALKAANIRSVLDTHSERLQAKIRNHTLQKVPFMGIIGNKELQTNTLSIRSRDGKDFGQMETSTFVTFLKEYIDKKVS